MHGSTMQHGGGVMVVGGCCAGPIGPAWLPQQGASFIIKQDSEPKHTSRLCQGYLTLMVMECCVLHPIERGWDEMELRVEPKEATGPQQEKKHFWSPPQQDDEENLKNRCSSCQSKGREKRISNRKTWFIFIVHSLLFTT